MNLLRFITCGSVDDGKSTLIGRLLYDSKSILTDQLVALEKATKGHDNGDGASVDLALLTDGLRSEREQGITIDVAYRYFQTPARKFIIVDAPGHIQYTRNMVTGASNCGLAIVLIDARHGVIEQTRRHSLICSVLGIRQMVVAVNKMDLVGFDQARFLAICAEYAALSGQLNLPAVTYIPMSALNGDNVVDRSENMVWYTGPTLLEHLETVEVADHQATDKSAGRLPIQYVIRPQTVDLPDYRGYAGRIESGQFSVGEAVLVLPSGEASTIDKIEFFGEALPNADAGQSVILHLADNRDISRGDLIVSAVNPPALSQNLTGTVCWMDSRPLRVGNKYLLQIGTARVRCAINAIPYRLNIETYAHEEHPESLNLNDLGQINLKTAKPVPTESYAQNQATGAAILIDETTNVTVGAVMIG